MRKLLITGGAGFIGSHFVRYWLNNYARDTVIVLDKLTYAGNLANLSDVSHFANYHFFAGDINDTALLNDLFCQFNIDTIVNFAAESHVDKSIAAAQDFMQTNIMGTHNLLAVAKHYWLDFWKLAQHRFHQISTDEVFGTLTNDAPAFTENNLYLPNSPYAASKAAADHLVRSYHHTYGLNTTVSHCSNNYGSHHYPEKLIPLCITRILQGQTLPIYGDGQQIRDWLNVLDHCRGIATILERGTTGESYNIGGYDGETSNWTLIAKLCAITDKLLLQNPDYMKKYPAALPYHSKNSHTLMQHVTDRLGHDRRYAINSQKIQHELDFHYTISLEQGLHDTVSWYLENDFWWR